ncbi:MAG: ComEC/Rec2 family competence protein [Oscillospiraceae bacterium]|nr:ComEC/Rec2 family competence protein [Oscillospiraceae bacterium]
MGFLTGIISMYILGIIFSYSLYVKQWYLCIVILILIFILAFNEQYFKKRTLIFILFFIVPIFSYFSIINTHFSNKIWVYVSKESTYGYIAQYNNLTVYLSGNFKKLANESLEGKNVLIKGTYSYKIDAFKGVLGNFKVDEIIKEENTLNYYIGKYKIYLYDKFRPYLGDKNTSYVMALVFGEDKFISKSEKDDLKTLGILHVLSVSGFHMVLIFGIFKRFFNVKTAILLTFLYLLLTGVDSSSLRAFIMIFIAKMSSIFHRSYNSKSALYFAALIILVMNPFNLFNIGFLLSFGATLGILMYNKKISKMLPSFLFKFNGELAMTISAQVFILPMLWLTFGGVNTIFLIGNILLIPFYTVIIYLSSLMFVLLEFNFIIVYLAKIINYLFYALDGAKRFLLNIDMPVLDFNAELCLLYILVFIFIATLKYTKRYRKELLVFTTCIYILATFL